MPTTSAESLSARPRPSPRDELIARVTAGSPGSDIAGIRSVSGANNDSTARRPPSSDGPTNAATISVAPFVAIPAAKRSAPNQRASGQISRPHHASEARSGPGRTQVWSKPVIAPAVAPTPQTETTSAGD